MDGSLLLLLLPDSKWDIDKSQLTLGKELGSGQFGVRILLLCICYVVIVCDVVLVFLSACVHGLEAGVSMKCAVLSHHLPHTAAQSG